MFDLICYFFVMIDLLCWCIYCFDVCDLLFEVNVGLYFVIIVGVGGDLMMEFIVEFVKCYLSMMFDLLLCFVYYIYILCE